MQQLIRALAAVLLAFVATAATAEEKSETKTSAAPAAYKIKHGLAYWPYTVESNRWTDPQFLDNVKKLRNDDERVVNVELWPDNDWSTLAEVGIKNLVALTTYDENTPPFGPSHFYRDGHKRIVTECDRLLPLCNRFKVDNIINFGGMLKPGTVRPTQAKFVRGWSRRANKLGVRVVANYKENGHKVYVVVEFLNNRRFVLPNGKEDGWRGHPGQLLIDVHAWVKMVDKANEGLDYPVFRCLVDLYHLQLMFPGEWFELATEVVGIKRTGHVHLAGSQGRLPTQDAASPIDEKKYVDWLKQNNYAGSVTQEFIVVDYTGDVQPDAYQQTLGSIENIE